jgi:endonuclease YncB( thermonuclease family)
VRWRQRGRPRPLWRTLSEAAIFLLVLAITLLGLQRVNVFDIGSGNATAKDGDSLTLNNTEVRLHGIDAPELHQSCRGPTGEYPCGREARDALRQLLRNRAISCTAIDGDRYNRAVSVCRDGMLDINNEMVRLGWAVAYFQHSTAYARAQKEAKSAKRGIWQGTFEMPEDFRERTRLP